MKHTNYKPKNPPNRKNGEKCHKVNVVKINVEKLSISGKLPKSYINIYTCSIYKCEK